MRRPIPFVLADSGRLLRLRRDVYPDPATWPSDDDARHLLRAQAELVVHHGAVVSHWSAARLWGLPQPLACTPGDACG